MNRMDIAPVLCELNHLVGEARSKMRQLSLFIITRKNIVTCEVMDIV